MTDLRFEEELNRIFSIHTPHTDGVATKLFSSIPAATFKFEIFRQTGG